MKELTFTAEVGGVPPEVVFQILYFDKDFLTRYHTEVNEDPDAKATKWTEDDTRVVTFQTPLNAPAIVAKCVGEPAKLEDMFAPCSTVLKSARQLKHRNSDMFVGTHQSLIHVPPDRSGADTLRVREAQTITRKTKDLYIVESIPRLDLPGGERFKTGGQVELRPSQKCSPGTAITMVARMECKLWGVGSMMENFMGEQAKKSFEDWLHMLNVVCREKVGMFGDGSESEEYFDVTEESFPEDASVDNEIMGEESEDWYLKTILKELRSLRSAVESTSMNLASLDVRLGKLEASLQTKSQNKGVSLGSDTLTSSLGWVALAGAFSVGALSAVHMYVKAHRFL